jgi:hypothetical protein
VNSFCNTAGGACSFNPGNVNCQSCQQNTDCAPSNYLCLGFIIEGQTQSFCGSNCATDADCPSGFECGGVILECSGPGSNCPPEANGTAVQCLAFNPVNEPAGYFCADPDGQPYVYSSACNPLSGFCPASDFP